MVSVHHGGIVMISCMGIFCDASVVRQPRTEDREDDEYQRQKPKQLS